jgi:hypothetical protein
MGNNALSIRHMIFLLHVMLDYSSPKELLNHASQLERMTNEENGANGPGCVVPGPFALDSGVIIPPVHFTNLPKVRRFELTCPGASLKVEKSREMKARARAKRRAENGTAKEDGSGHLSDEDSSSNPSPFIVSNLKLTGGGSYQKGKRTRPQLDTGEFYSRSGRCTVSTHLPLPSQT